MASTRGGLGGTTAAAIGSATATGASVNCVTVPNLPPIRPGRNPFLRPMAPLYDRWRRVACFQATDDHNTRLGLSSAGDEIGGHFPIFRGLGQFGLYILSFGVNPDRAPLQQRQALAQQQV